MMENESTVEPVSTLMSDVANLEQQNSAIKLTHSLSEEFNNNPLHRREIINLLEKHHALNDVSVTALNRVKNETEYFQVFDQIGLHFDFDKSNISIGKTRFPIRFNQKSLLKENRGARFSIGMFNTAKIDVSGEKPTAIDFFMNFIKTANNAQLPIAVGDMAHELVHGIQYLQELHEHKNGTLDRIRTTPVMSGRPIVEAIAWRTGQVTFDMPRADTANDSDNPNPLWKEVKNQGYEHQTNAGETEWQVAFQTIDNLLATGLNPVEITQLLVTDSKYVESVDPNTNERHGSYPTLESCIEDRLHNMGLTKKELPKLRKKLFLGRQIELNKAAAVCREELKKACKNLSINL